MNKQSIGSYEWSLHTKGALSRREKLKMIRMLVQSQVKDVVTGLAYKTGWMKYKLDRTDLDSIPLPDSEIAIRSIELAEDKYTPALLHHCYRTYYLGQLLGQADHLKNIDHELLFTGCMLHDVGIASGHIHEASGCCFSIEGAHFAQNLALEYQWSETQAKKLFTSISAHLNPVVNKKTYGNEGYLLGAGAMLDVIGARHYAVPAQVLHQVHAKHPRTGFEEEIVETMQHPHLKNSRAHFLGKMGFARLAGKNPLNNFAK